MTGRPCRWPKSRRQKTSSPIRVYSLIYRMAVWPKNLAATRPPQRREATDEIYFRTIRHLQETGVQEAPAGIASATGAGGGAAGPTLREHILRQVAAMENDTHPARPAPALRVVRSDDDGDRPAESAVVPDRAAE